MHAKKAKLNGEGIFVKFHYIKNPSLLNHFQRSHQLPYFLTHPHRFHLEHELSNNFIRVLHCYLWYFSQRQYSASFFSRCMKTRIQSDNHITTYTSNYRIQLHFRNVQM